MKKTKTIDLLRIPDSEKAKLILEIRRRIQHKALEEKLTRSLLSSNMNINCENGINCENVTSASIEDLMQKVMQKAIEEPKAQKSYSWLII